ncbi:spermatogenesis-associated protein 17-like [Aulostomus maculatus]
MVKLRVEEFQKLHFNRLIQAEEARERENRAAVRIQSWFRGCVERAYLSHLHDNAVIIQTIWRGFSARARYRQMVKVAYFDMRMNFYNEMAVRIQKRWRGFLARKYIHNFYERKSYLEGVSMTNNPVRRAIDELDKLLKRQRDCLERVKEQAAKMRQAQRSHHLLSTLQRPGVFNSPLREAPHEMELLMRQAKSPVPTRPASRAKVGFLGAPTPTASRGRRTHCCSTH